MAENNEKLDQLLGKLELISKRQKAFSEEVDSLREEIFRLKNTASGKPAEKEVKKAPDIVVHSTPEHREPVPGREAPKTLAAKADLEKFIGENLINKIGIIITVIGVAIGAKYAIDHQLISPLASV